jgi:hypothetical protein
MCCCFRDKCGIELILDTGKNDYLSEIAMHVRAIVSPVVTA